MSAQNPDRSLVEKAIPGLEWFTARNDAVVQSQRD